MKTAHMATGQGDSSIIEKWPPYLNRTYHVSKYKVTTPTTIPKTATKHQWKGKQTKGKMLLHMNKGHVFFTIDY